MEESLSLPELLSVMEALYDKDYADKKFAAALKGVDLDKQNNDDAWGNLLARVASKGQAVDSNDIVSLQGSQAVREGFGIGMGLEYEVIE